MADDPAKPPDVPAKPQPAPPDSNLRLPEQIPERWVQQISQGVKSESAPRLSTLLLGSSVIAAVIGIFSSFVTAHITGSENRKLELTKAQIQRDSETVRRAADAYEQLQKDLDVLSDRLEGTRILISEAGDNASHATAQRIATELKGIGQAALAVRDSKASRFISKGLATHVDQALASFLPSLADAQSDRMKLKLFVSAIEPAQAQIKTAKLSLIRVQEALKVVAGDVRRSGQPDGSE